MINKMKNWLGIEGVKMEIILDENYDVDAGEVQGVLRFTSIRPQTVTGIKLSIVEKYERGRGKEKLIDEYELGNTYLHQTLEIPENGSVEINFRLPFTLNVSKMDSYGARNFLTGGIAKVLKKIERVKSTFRIEAEADIPGVGLNPFDKKELKLV